MAAPCTADTYPDASVESSARWTTGTALAFMRVFLGTAAGMPSPDPNATQLTNSTHAETLAFHGGMTLTCAVLMRLLDLVYMRFPPSSPSTSSIRRDFRYAPAVCLAKLS